MSEGVEAGHGPGRAAGPPGRLTLRTLLLGAVLPIVFLLQGLATIGDFGETFDEKFDRNIGHYYYRDWSTRGVKGLEETFIPLQRNYGPLFDVLVVASEDHLHAKRKILKTELAAFHFPILCVTALAVFAVFLVGAGSFGVPTGLLASLIFCLTPQVVAHSQNNLKDTPLMAFFALSIAAFLWAVKRDRLPLYLVAGALAGLTYAIKINALLIYPIVGLWFVLFVGRSLRAYLRFTAGMALSLVASLGAILAAWPYYRFETWKRFPETLKVFSGGAAFFNEEVFYLGKHTRAPEIPWHYPFVQLGVTTPLLFLSLLLLAALFTARELKRKSGEGQVLGLLFVWLLFPLVLQAASGASMYDGVRHYLAVLPPLAICAAYGAVKALQAVPMKARIAGGVALGAGLSFVLVRLVALHPYAIVYYNALTGGTRGAAERFELDYWGHSFAEAERWVKRATPPGSRLWMPIGQSFFNVDEGRSFVLNQTRLPNYKIHLVRGMLRLADPTEDYRNPSRKPVFTVSRDGADLLRIFAYPENTDLPDGTVLSPQATGGAEPGLSVTRYANGEYAPPVAESTVRPTPEFDSASATEDWREANFSIRFAGFLKVDAPGPYFFELSSDDDGYFGLSGRRVTICPSTGTVRKRLTLSPGYYPLDLRFRNDIGPAHFHFRMARDSADALAPVDAAAFSH